MFRLARLWTRVRHDGGAKISSAHLGWPRIPLDLLQSRREMPPQYSAMGTLSRDPWFYLALGQAKRCFLQRRGVRLLRAKQPPRENISYEAMRSLWARQFRPAT